MREVRFHVNGLPAPQGSMKPVPGRGRLEGRTLLIPDNQTELLRWRGRVIDASRAARDAAGIDGPLSAVMVVMRFTFPRPMSDFGTGRNAGRLKAGAPLEKVTGPDLDKLQRAVFDSLTQSSVVRDDKVIVEVRALKSFGDPGVDVDVYELELFAPDGRTHDPTVGVRPRQERLLPRPMQSTFGQTQSLEFED